MVRVDLRELLCKIGFAKSKSEAGRLIKQGAVKIGNKKVTNPKALADETQNPVRLFFV